LSNTGRFWQHNSTKNKKRDSIENQGDEGDTNVPQFFWQFVKSTATAFTPCQETYWFNQKIRR